ncbi:SCP-like protein [Necator americanus]|uniref:SCP-like protein n=1 Tax=Necator americanus TaxID=51031 RepID=W2TWF3_NECAM|nr:SCP-like protein [Necator americanus]ETN86183.1 SCP-like protein [Necator americanus]
MTDTLRNLVLKTHNENRALLSQGYVANGRADGPRLGPATNMLRMASHKRYDRLKFSAKYDFSLETEAQAYADKCSLVGSGPNSGQNTHVIQSKSVSAFDALKKSMSIWWNEIYSTSVGKNLIYTSRLQAKRDAPTRFTQMAWADTYKVGCGIKRCSSKTFVVCRYDPP